MPLPSKYIKNPITRQNLHYKQLGLSPVFSLLDFSNVLLNGLSRLRPLSTYRSPSWPCPKEACQVTLILKTAQLLHLMLSKRLRWPGRISSSSDLIVDLTFYSVLLLLCFGHTGLLPFAWTLQPHSQLRELTLAAPFAWDTLHRYLHDFLPYFHQIFVQISSQ